VYQANDAMGLEGSGSLPEQVAALMEAMGLEEEDDDDGGGDGGGGGGGDSGGDSGAGDGGEGAEVVDGVGLGYEALRRVGPEQLPPAAPRDLTAPVVPVKLRTAAWLKPLLGWDELLPPYRADEPVPVHPVDLAGVGGRYVVALLIADSRTSRNEQSRSEVKRFSHLLQRFAWRLELRGLIICSGSEAHLDALRTLAPTCHALPHDAHDARGALLDRFAGRRVRFPFVVLLGADGSLLCADGLAALASEEDGLSGFPWAAAHSAHAAKCPQALVQCPHEGCTEVCTRAQIGRHKQLCPRRPFPCKLRCGFMFAIVDMGAHLKECPERKAHCDRGCDLPTTLRELRDGSHYAICPKLISACPACGKILPREAMQAHTATCLIGLELCRYGCGMMLLRADMDDHGRGGGRVEQCKALGLKPHPKCDGYCCRRAPLTFDAAFKQPKGGRGGRGDVELGPPHVERRHWMMEEPLSKFWKPDDA